MRKNTDIFWKKKSIDKCGCIRSNNDMKILLVQDPTRLHHVITQKHVQQIQSIVPQGEVVLVSSDDEEKVNRHLEGADVLAGTLWSLPEIRDTKNLKWIHSFSAGVEHVLTPEVRNSDVIVGNVAGIHATPIAEHIIAFLLIFTRRLRDSFISQQRKIWQKDNKLTELKDKTVLIVGLGHIGSETARLASAFGARVIAVDRAGKEKPDFVSELYPSGDLKKALPQADFVVLTLPYTEETHHLFDMEKFRIMKQSAVLLNVGRGKVVHEQELIDALRQKMIAGAALDVFQEEPLSQESSRWGRENVVITPHQSGISEKYMDRAVEVFCENLRAYLAGERLPNLVDKQRGY